MSNETDDPNATATEIPEEGAHGAGNGAPTIASADRGPGKTFHKKRRKHRNGHAPSAPAAVSRPSDPPAMPAEASPIAPEPAPEPPTVSADAEPTPELPPPAPQDSVEPSAQEIPASISPTDDELRLRMKVWTDPRTGLRYLMPTAFMRDVVNGQPVSNVMRAYAMRDDDTKLVTLTAIEWNALPFFYFQQDGPAPRATARPVDVIS